MRDGLRALRTRRRVQRLRHLDWVDALYRAYVVGISSIAALMTLAFVVGDTAAGRATVDAVRDHGPAVVGVVAALAIALGLRSGSHGGPLAFESADVQNVLLAPIDRGIVVRGAAYRQLRGVISSGIVVGAIVGVVTAPRLGGAHPNLASWVFTGIGFGVALALATWGSALLAGVLRLGQLAALLIGGVLVLWSGLDIAVDISSSPPTWLGHLALLPLDANPLAAAGVAAVGAVIAVGLARADRVSLEPALHRAQLVRALRFAATIQDLRAVITLRRQLSHEIARSRPWIRLRPATPTGRAGWRRDWHGILRWPGSRVVRVLVLTLVAGASCAAALMGTTPLFAVAGIAAYLVALDAVEGLAQEYDHPDRGSGFPTVPGDLALGHLYAPAVLMAVLGATGAGAAAITNQFGSPAAGTHAISPIVAAIVVVTVAVAGPAAAAIGAYLGRPDRNMSTGLVHPGLLVAQQVAPLVIVTLAFLPLLVARETSPPSDPVANAITAATPALVIAFGIVTFLRSQRSDVS